MDTANHYIIFLRIVMTAMIINIAKRKKKSINRYMALKGWPPKLHHLFVVQQWLQPQLQTQAINANLYLSFTSIIVIILLTPFVSKFQHINSSKAGIQSKRYSKQNHSQEYKKRRTLKQGKKILQKQIEEIEVREHICIMI